METENLIHSSKKSDLIWAKKHMNFWIFLFLFHSSHEPKAENQRRCFPLGGHPRNRAKQEVFRVVEFHIPGTFIFNLVYINFKGSILFFTYIFIFFVHFATSSSTIPTYPMLPPQQKNICLTTNSNAFLYYLIEIYYFSLIVFKTFQNYYFTEFS